MRTRVTFDSNNDANPVFAADGRKLFFQRIEATGGNTPNSVQIYSVALERLERDPDDAEERAETEAPATPASRERKVQPALAVRAGCRPIDAVRRVKPKWIGTGMKRRTRQITRMPFPVSSYTVGAG